MVTLWVASHKTVNSNWHKRESEGSGSILKEAKEELGDRLGGGRLPRLCWPPASPSPSWLHSPLLQPTSVLHGRSSTVDLSILVTAHFPCGLEFENPGEGILHQAIEVDWEDYKIQTGCML